MYLGVAVSVILNSQCLDPPEGPVVPKCGRYFCFVVVVLFIYSLISLLKIIIYKTKKLSVCFIVSIFIINLVLSVCLYNCNVKPVEISAVLLARSLLKEIFNINETFNLDLPCNRKILTGSQWLHIITEQYVWHMLTDYNNILNSHARFLAHTPNHFLEDDRFWHNTLKLSIANLVRFTSAVSHCVKVLSHLSLLCIFLPKLDFLVILCDSLNYLSYYELFEHKKGF